MICPRCHQEQEENRTECGACGVVFERYRPRPHAFAPEPQEPAKLQQVWLLFRERAFPEEADPNPIVLGGRALVLLVLLGMTLAALKAPIEGHFSILHHIHLPFHEAGHVLFSPFGRFLHVLGGTLGQLLVPGLVLGSFLLRAQAFGASVGLWWLGHSFIDCAPYIHDARAGRLELLGGVTGQEMPDYHDWEVLLGMLGWLKHDHTLARVFWVIGALLLLLALAWGSRQLWKGFLALQRG